MNKKILYLSEKYSSQRGVSLCLALTLFMLPLSSSGKSIFLALSVIAILSSARLRARLPEMVVKPWCLLGFTLLLLSLLACFWSPASYSEQFFVVEKYSKLLYLPILAVGFSQESTRRWGLHAFLWAMLITCMIAILKFHGFLSSFAINPDKVFRNHIMTGFMLAFASYLSLVFFYQKCAYRLQIGYLTLTVIYTYHLLFINGGRMAYIIYLVMMILLVYQLFNWRQAFIGLLIVGSLFTGCYLASPMMKLRLHSLSEERYQKESSVGMRLQFQAFAHRLFNQHPIKGNGTASFTYNFQSINPVPAWGHRLWEPHNQYWLIACEFGILGLIVLSLFFYAIYNACRQLSLTYRLIMTGMLVPFFIGNLSDSLLFYSGSGYFFLLIVAICLGETVRCK
jgi:O-antigen ligase